MTEKGETWLFPAGLPIQLGAGPSEGVAGTCQRGLELEDGSGGYRAGKVSCSRGR